MDDGIEDSISVSSEIDVDFFSGYSGDWSVTVRGRLPYKNDSSGSTLSAFTPILGAEHGILIKNQ